MSTTRHAGRCTVNAYHHCVADCDTEHHGGGQSDHGRLGHVDTEGCGLLASLVIYEGLEETHDSDHPMLLCSVGLQEFEKQTLHAHHRVSEEQANRADNHGGRESATAR